MARNKIKQGKQRVWREERKRSNVPMVAEKCALQTSLPVVCEGECVGVSTGQELVGSSSLDAGVDGGIMGVNRVVSPEETDLA